MMLIALAVVLYAIRSLRSPDVAQKAADPQSALGVLLGGDYRPLNWCPQGVTKIELFADSGELTRILESKGEISSVCEIMTAGFSSEGLEEAVYIKRLAVHGPLRGEIVILEQAQGQAVFRVKGLPFGSPMLNKALARLATP